MLPIACYYIHFLAVKNITVATVKQKILTKHLIMTDYAH